MLRISEQSDPLVPKGGITFTHLKKFSVSMTISLAPDQTTIMITLSMLKAQMAKLF